MDKELIKKIVVYTIGGAIGAVVGVGAATFILDNFVEEELDELEDEESEEKTQESLFETVMKARQERQEKKTREKKGPTNYSEMSKNVPPDLQRLADRYRKGPVEEAETTTVPELVEGVLEGTIDRTKPYFITRLEFEEEMMTHQKALLNFYEDDDVLTDAEDNSVILNTPEKFLGNDGLTSFGKDEQEPDVVHIRNEALGTDYEINLLHASYEETVVGRKTKKKTHDRSRVVKVPAAKEVNEDEY